MLNMHASIGTGTDFFGYPVPEPRKSLYVMCERNELSLRRRWHKVAHAKCAGLDPGERKKFEQLLHENCFLKAIAGESLNLIEFVHNQWQPAYTVIDALIAELKAVGITVVFFDPLSRLHGGNENDAAVGSAITRALERIVQLAGCSVLIAHHTGKNVRDDMHGGRGTSAFNDNTSETILLTMVEKDDRTNLIISGLRPDEQFYDIVKMTQHRCADGPKAPDMYLVRDGETGLLRRIMVEKKSPEAVLGEDIGAVRKWAAGLTPAGRFSKNEFIVAAMGGFGSTSLSRQGAKEAFNSAVEMNLFIAATDVREGRTVPSTRRGYPLYCVKSPEDAIFAVSSSLPAMTRTTGQHRKTARF